MGTKAKHIPRSLSGTGQCLGAPTPPVLSFERGRTTPNLKARKSIPGLWATFSPVRRGLFPVVRDFLCIIPTEQVLYYRNLGLYYGLASGTLPLYSGPCLGVKGGCVSCDLVLKGGGKTPTPKISALLRKRPALLRANFVLTKDRKRPYYRHFCGKIHREGSCSKAAGVLSKVQMLNLVLGVGVFSFLPISWGLFRNPQNRTTCLKSTGGTPPICTAVRPPFLTLCLAGF